MKTSIAYQEISLPETPLSSPGPVRQISYSRHLEGNRRVQTANTNFFHQTEGGEALQTVDVWNKEIVTSRQVKKDDMLKVLKGKNYMLTSHQRSKLQTHELTNKKICRSLVKNYKVANKSKCDDLSRCSHICLQKRRKESKPQKEK